MYPVSQLDTRCRYKHKHPQQPRGWYELSDWTMDTRCYVTEVGVIHICELLGKIGCAINMIEKYILRHSRMSTYTAVFI